MFYLFFLIYNIFWFIAIIVFIIYYLSRFEGDILVDRLNIDGEKNPGAIWIHASSVGEVKITENLIKEIRKHTMEPIVLTVVTRTGRKIAKSIKSHNLLVKYAPFDFLPIVLSFISSNSIKTAIFIETEIWPSYIIANKFKNIRQFIVNARLSDKSYPKYRFFKFFFKPIISKMSIIFAQTQEDKKRFCNLGIQKERVLVVNNLKYDLLDVAEDANHLKNDVFATRPTFTAGSLRDGEEEIIVNVVKDLISKFDDLLAVIAPRHLENVAKIEKMLIKKNIKYVCYSDFKKFLEGVKYLKPAQKQLDANVILLDVMGALVGLYKNSDVVFVGGSLVSKGGQNIIEPACLGKLVLFGPHMQNFRDASQKFLDSGGAIQVANGLELSQNVEKYLKDKNARTQMVHKVLRCLKDSRGGTKETILHILAKN